MRQIYIYAIKILCYVLDNSNIPQLPEDVDFEALFQFSKSHSIENMVYIGLRDLKADVPEDVMKKFEEAYQKAIMVEAMQEIELEQITAAFEEMEIDFVPLKGSVLKHLYPMPDYRKSGDIDILMKTEDEEKIKSVLNSLGYEYNHTYEKHEAHIEFEKPPCIVLEMHRRLLGEANRAAKINNIAWDNASLCDGFGHRYEFSPEYLYVYSVAHIAKHLKSGGAGIKLMADLWFIEKFYSLDRKKTDELLKIANLAEIADKLWILVDKWFNNKECSDELILMLEDYIFKGGSFGTAVQNLTMNANEEKNKTLYTIKYKAKKIWKDIFEPYDYMKQKYPVLIKHKILLPVMWVYRLIAIPFTEMDKIKRHMNMYIHSNIDKSANLQDIFEIVR